MVRLLLALWAGMLPALLPAADQTAAGLASLIRETGLDPDECYRVRDLSFTKQDIRFYLTDGYLILGKPIAGRRVTALFASEPDSGDAEVLLFAPTRSERMALAAYTESPTLNEHFGLAVMLFTDDTLEVLSKQLQAPEPRRKSPEMGVLLARQWDQVARNLASSVETRLVQDLLAPYRPEEGFFYAALNGKKLGNFDVVYDPGAREQITVGKLTYRDNRSYFDVWTSFEARPFRNRPHQAHGPEFKLSDFRIDVTLEPDLHLKAVTRVTLSGAPKGMAALPFDISPQVRVTQALVDGEPAEVFQRDSLRVNLVRGTGNETILIVPPRVLDPSRPHEFEFHHEGSVIADEGNRVYYVGSRGNWYPNRSLQFARYDLTFRYPQGLSLVSAGEIVEDRTEGNVRVTRRKVVSPIRLAGFNLGDYLLEEISRGGYSVQVCANRRLERALQPKAAEVVVIPRPAPAWGMRRPGEVLTVTPAPLPSPDPAARLRQLATEIAGAFEFMAALFGPPPLHNLTVSPVPGAFGQGFPGLVYLSTISYLDPSDRPAATRNELQETFFSEMLHAHEIAHQWWGNVVTVAGHQDEWLTEALANYSALLYLEKRKGPKALDFVLGEYRNHLLIRDSGGRTIESAGPIVWGARLNSSQSPRAWRLITYEKGTWIVHMLRRRMGDERFMAMLGELRRRYEYRSISTEEFRQFACGFLPPQSVDPQLEAFFENWVYSTGIPALKLNSSVRGKAPAVKVTANLEQSDVDPEFSADVPVEIQFAKAKPVTVWLRSGGEPSSFTRTFRQAPLRVQLDPASSVLAVKK